MYDSGRISSLRIKSFVNTLPEKVESPKITGTKILVDGDSWLIATSKAVKYISKYLQNKCPWILSSGFEHFFKLEKRKKKTFFK